MGAKLATDRGYAAAIKGYEWVRENMEALRLKPRTLTALVLAIQRQKGVTISESAIAMILDELKLPRRTLKRHGSPSDAGRLDQLENLVRQQADLIHKITERLTQLEDTMTAPHVVRVNRPELNGAQTRPLATPSIFPSHEEHG